MKGTYRKVKASFWEGDLAIELSGDTDAFAVAFYVLTCPAANSIGVFRLPVSTLVEDLGIDTERASKALRKLSDRGFLHYDDRYRMVFIVEAARHEWGEVPNANDNRVRALKKALPDLVATCRKSSVWSAFWERYGLTWDDPMGLSEVMKISPSEGLGDSSPTRNDPVNDTDTDPVEGGLGDGSPSGADQLSFLPSDVDAVFDAHDTGIKCLVEMATAIGREDLHGLQTRKRTAARRKLVRKALNDFGAKTVLLAARNLVLSAHHRGENKQKTQYLDIDYALKKPELHAGRCQIDEQDGFRRFLQDSFSKASGSVVAATAPPKHSGRLQKWKTKG